jgi:hypothetical protein
MQANKNNQYQIKEKEKGFYHLKFTLEIPTADERNIITDERFQIFSPLSFKQYLENKKHFNWKKEEIIHDPTLVVESRPETAKVEEPPATDQVQPEKKQPYFGSDRQKADIERKKQLKNEAK